MEEKRANEVYIPPNFKEGVSVFGFMIKISNLVQAIPFIAVILILVFTFGKNLPVLTKTVIILATCLPVAFIAMVGFNGDSLFGFIKNLVRERKTRRAYYYNPRVKTEIKPYDPNDATMQQLPREKLLLFMERMKSTKTDDTDYEDDINIKDLFFEDDEGLVEKPVEYMTRKERRAYNKALKKGELIFTPEEQQPIYRRIKKGE